MTAFLGVLYLLVFLAAGCTCVRFLLPRKSLLTRVWLGVSLGLLLMMWLPALIAFAVDFTWTAHLLDAAVGVSAIHALPARRK